MWIKYYIIQIAFLLTIVSCISNHCRHVLHMIEISISTVPYIPVIDIKKNKAFLYIIIVN